MSTLLPVDTDNVRERSTPNVYATFNCVEYVKVVLGGQLGGKKAPLPEVPELPRTAHTSARDGIELELVRAASKGIDAKPSTSMLAPATAPQTAAQRRRARIQFVALCWTLFLAGWNNGSTGLPPRAVRGAA